MRSSDVSRDPGVRGRPEVSPREAMLDAFE
jgi:hypothetical protein